MVVFLGYAWFARMIKVSQQAEYPAFDRSVRQPGLAFLRQTPRPTSRQFNRRNYWNRALTELHAAYAGICAYTAMYLPDRGTVDHFFPKGTFPRLAYEWTNYRLSSGRVNGFKGKSTDVLDPFQIGDDWFHLDVPSCLIRANGQLGPDLKAQIHTTIDILRLNSDDTYVQERCNILVAFAKDEIKFDFLNNRYPFLAREVIRLDIVDVLHERFRL